MGGFGMEDAICSDENASSIPKATVQLRQFETILVRHGGDCSTKQASFLFKLWANSRTDTWVQGAAGHDTLEFGRQSAL